jgi:integrase
MTCIVERKSRFYVVAYDGLDPLTGRERRRWIPIGHDRAEADTVAARLDNERVAGPPPKRGTVTVAEFLTRTWMPHKRRHVRATTAYRYAWFIDRYINPAVGDIALRRLRADHLDELYERLATTGGREGTGLAPKTIAEVHMIVRAALEDAVTRELIGRNVACHVRSRRRPPAQAAARSWTAQELHQFLTAASSQRLYPALHLAAHTGMRRGEIVGLKWSHLDIARSRLSISRSLQNVGGKPVEFGVKTRTSRRTVELDHHTRDVLASWRRRLQDEHLPQDADDWMFCNTHGRFLNPESVTQLFDRIVQRSAVPRIRFHDLRIPTPRSSLPMASPSRSCPNDSVTPIRHSRCTPTMTACPRSSRSVVSGGQAAEGFSSACCATVTPSALAMSHSRARLVER